MKSDDVPTGTEHPQTEHPGCRVEIEALAGPGRHSERDARLVREAVSGVSHDLDGCLRLLGRHRPAGIDVDRIADRRGIWELGMPRVGVFPSLFML